MDLGKLLLFVVFAAVLVGFRVGVWKYVRRPPEGEPAKTPRWYWIAMAVGVLVIGVWVALPH